MIVSRLWVFSNHAVREQACWHAVQAPLLKWPFGQPQDSTCPSLDLRMSETGVQCTYMSSSGVGHRERHNGSSEGRFV